jgi:hypothetical protein
LRHGTQKEILLKISKVERHPQKISDRHQRQGGELFREDNPAGGIEVVTKPPLRKCSTNNHIA